MPMNRFASPAPRRLRPTGPSCRGGASSLLRLTQPACGRLPTAPDLAEWMNHAASVLMPVTGPLAMFVASGDAR
jgi:hypothetical protein